MSELSIAQSAHAAGQVSVGMLRFILPAELPPAAVDCLVRVDLADPEVAFTRVSEFLAIVLGVDDFQRLTEEVEAGHIGPGEFTEFVDQVCLQYAPTCSGEAAR